MALTHYLISIRPRVDVWAFMEFWTRKEWGWWRGGGEEAGCEGGEVERGGGVGWK